MRKWIVLIILIALGVIAYNYVYKDHRDIKAESPEFHLSTIDISKEFEINPITSEQKYINKTIEITGVISEINQNNLTLNEKVFCLFNNSINQSIKIKSETIIKGRVIGYDNLLEQVKLDQCIIINK